MNLNFHCITTLAHEEITLFANRLWRDTNYFPEEGSDSRLRFNQSKVMYYKWTKLKSSPLSFLSILSQVSYTLIPTLNKINNWIK